MDLGIKVAGSKVGPCFSEVNSVPWGPLDMLKRSQRAVSKMVSC